MLALSAAACGSDSEASNLTPHQFLSKAGRICVKAGKKQFEAFESALEAENNGRKFKPAAKDDVERLTVEVVLPWARRMVDELSDLADATREPHRVKPLISNYRAGIQSAMDRPDTFLSGQAFAEANKEARTFGLLKCQI